MPIMMSCLTIDLYCRDSGVKKLYRDCLSIFLINCLSGSYSFTEYNTVINNFNKLKKEIYII